MLSVEDAWAEVLRHAKQPRVPVRVAATAALGCVLVEDLQSDMDSPPYDKSLVDGYAVRSTDVRAEAAVELRILEEVTAGETPTLALRLNDATRIMTGAPMPDGADAVVMIEQTTLVTGNEPRVRVHPQRVQAGQNVLRRGAAMRLGDEVLSRGSVIRPATIGLLAEIGQPEVKVVPRPSVAILSTGNELVPCHEKPAHGQIRNSNGPMLEALVVDAGGRPVGLGIARDEHEHLAELIRQGLREDVLLISGGVSAGVLDLVPAVLQENGVEQVFHKVNLKPGKPLWFGVCPKPVGATLVFGLPGNPVSSLVCFELFVRHALASLACRTHDSMDLRIGEARLAAAHRHRGERPTYYPAGFQPRAGALRTVMPLGWQGSADLYTLTLADCLICFPPGDHDYQIGDVVTIRFLHRDRS